MVAARLPDPLADRFIPIDAEAEGFEGGVSLEGGLKLKAVFTTSSEEAADQLVETLKGMLVSLPVATRGIEIRIDQNTVSSVHGGYRGAVGGGTQDKRTCRG